MTPAEGTYPIDFHRRLAVSSIQQPSAIGDRFRRRFMDLVPLGDAAALAYLADEIAALRFADAVRKANER